MYLGGPILITQCLFLRAKDSMNECWKVSLKIKREGNHWFAGGEEFMEEGLSLASSINSSKDWLDSDRKKRGNGGSLFRYKKKGK